MQTKYCELFEWSLILQERCCLSSMHFQTLSGCLQSPSGGWQYCGSTSLCSTPAHPLAKAPQNAHLEMVLSEWKSPMSVLHAAAKIFCLTWFVCVCVCVCVCVECMCMCVCVCCKPGNAILLLGVKIFLDSHCLQPSPYWSLSTSGTFSLTSLYLSLGSTV